MGLLWKGLGICFVCCVLGLFLGKQEKGYALLLSLAGSAAVMIISASYLEPVMEFLRCLEGLGGLHREFLGVIIKALGIGIVTEIASMICADSGNQSLSKAVQFLGTTAILWLSVPVYTALLELIGVFLEEL